jgi:hypothetical protein
VGFKVKSWNLWRTVNMQELVGLQAGGANVRGFAFPWAGQILCLGYDGSDNPLWSFYDPVSNTATTPQAGGGAPWSYNYGGFGWAPSKLLPWGSRYVFSQPGAIGYYFGAEFFYGWDAEGNFLCPTIRLSGLNISSCLPAAAYGTDGSGPTLLAYQFSSTTRMEYITATGPGGTAILLENENPVGTQDTDIYVGSVGGSARYDLMRQLGGYYGWYRTDVGNVLYPTIPREGTKDSYVGVGHFGFPSGNMGVTGGMVPLPSGVGGYMQNVVGGSTYWSTMADPLTEVGQPYPYPWVYRSAQHGLALNEYDLDGAAHGGAAIPIDYGYPMTKCGSWLISIPSNDFNGGVAFSVYVLDPVQPAGRARRSTRPANGDLGWVGDYQIGTDLSLRHVLPFPDSRAPAGGSQMPPQDRDDGFVLGSKEVFQRAGATLQYVRDVTIDLSSYGHGEDWWFPGEDPVTMTYPGFWFFFAGGGPTIMGYMPDPTWGALNPLGDSCMFLMGSPTEDLRALKTHTLHASDTLTGASFAVPLTDSGIGTRRTMLSSGFDGRTFTFVTTGTRAGAPPAWKAVIGTIAGKTWTTVKEFSDDDMPGLGETDWTIWSVVPIPACAALPQGGWLVGATLYFDPWEEWEWTPGAREATFLDTGNGWVPAKPGWRGPLHDDDHHPILLSAYDEWTFGRSRYGPDALLVYDHLGSFVTHLNSLEVHPPDGREIIVTGELNPRVVFRIYRHGTYSDFAEGYGQYHHLDTDEEIQAPLYACYDLLSGGQIRPGLGTFRGFVDMYEVGNYAPKNATWRWSVPNTLYDWQYPQSFWSPPSGAYVRSGRGAGGVTILGGKGSGRTGVRGVGARSGV